MKLIAFYSSIYNIDPVLVQSVIAVESKFKSDVVGSHGEVGLMQLRPEYSKVGRSELFKPHVNIKQGVEFLATVKKYCKHQSNFEWVVCYNVGITGGSKIKHPKLHEYYRKVVTEYYYRGR